MRKSTQIILSLLIFITFNSFSQSVTETDSTRNILLKAAREVIAAAKNCALITQDNEGRSRVRVMDPFLPDNDFVVWFGTNPKSRKVAQIKNDPRVTLYYFDPTGIGYVMIHGIAQLVDEEKEKHFKEEWLSFYADKADSFLPIKVSPEWLEVVSYNHDILGDPITWEPAIVLFNAEE
ncbi:MAG: general stress protein 26 [Arcticibacterium sp.]|jgi:general stress protein 26